MSLRRHSASFSTAVEKHFPAENRNGVTSTCKYQLWPITKSINNEVIMIDMHLKEKVKRNSQEGAGGD